MASRLPSLDMQVGLFRPGGQRHGKTTCLSELGSPGQAWATDIKPIPRFALMDPVAPFVGTFDPFPRSERFVTGAITAPVYWGFPLCRASRPQENELGSGTELFLYGRSAGWMSSRMRIPCAAKRAASDQRPPQVSVG